MDFLFIVLLTLSNCQPTQYIPLSGNLLPRSSWLEEDYLWEYGAGKALSTKKAILIENRKELELYLSGTDLQNSEALVVDIAKSKVYRIEQEPIIITETKEVKTEKIEGYKWKLQTQSAKQDITK